MPAAVVDVQQALDASTREYSDSDRSDSQSVSRSHSYSQSESGFFGSWSSTSHLTPSERAAAKAKQAEAEAALRAQQIGGAKTITFGGGLAFLINNVTGGGMVLFPVVFQQAGWVVVICSLLAVCVLVTVSAFMLIEAMSMMPGNKRFQKRVEYTSLTKHYLPNKLYWASQLFFQLSLTCNCIAMIVQSCQVMDFTIAELFGRSCAVPQFYPEFQFHCPSPVVGEGTVFGHDSYQIPLGWFLTLCVVVPLGFVNLDENIFVQKGGFIALLSIVVVWCGIFISQGLDGSRVPAVGNSFTQVVGVVVFNFAMITSIPSWVNEKKESVSIVKSFAVAMPLAVGIFMCLGLFGGLAFDKFANDQTILVVVYGLGTKIAKITFFLFPACVNLTSIPVFSILQRYNLVTSGVCGKKMALFLAVFVPWAISIPLYTGSGYELVVTWSGICITSVVNFVVPPVLYLLAIRETKQASERRASVRQMTGLRASGLTMHGPGGSLGGHSVGSKPGSRPESVLGGGALSKQSSASGLRENGAAEHAAIDMPHGSTTAGVDPTVDIAAPPPSARKMHSASALKKQREKEKSAERAAERARKAKEKKDARRKKREEEMVPDEGELTQPTLLPVLPFVFPRTWWERVTWMMMLPIKLAFYYTIPHPATFRQKVSQEAEVTRFGKVKLAFWTVTSILSSFLWLSGLAYMSIWCCALLAEGTTIHPFLLGICLLGVGTRVPAFLTEFKGYQGHTGDLNRVFLNNVLQVVICLPVPWLLYHAFHMGKPVVLYAGPIIVLCLMFFIMGALVVIVFRSYDWIASKPVKVPLICMTVFFFAAVWLLDYSVILSLNEDQCAEPE